MWKYLLIIAALAIERSSQHIISLFSGVVKYKFHRYKRTFSAECFSTIDIFRKSAIIKNKIDQPPSSGVL